MSPRNFSQVATAALLLSCSGADGQSGIDEPIRVQQAQFVPGQLPGFEPNAEDVASDLPTTSAATAETALLRERQSGIDFSGFASLNASAIGVQVHDAGSGYYLFPTGPVDAQDRERYTWRFQADLQESLGSGVHDLYSVAFDEDGRPGKQSRATICVRSLRPDNGNSCYKSVAPPALVVSLEWDAAVDLDLILVAPSGVVVSPKRPTTAQAGGLDPAAESVGYLTHDSNQECVIDGRQREDIVFEQRPEPGIYRVYANLSRGCNESHVSYLASRHARVTTEGGYGVDSRDLGAGSLIAEQANGGSQLGTFVAEFKVD